MKQVALAVMLCFLMLGCGDNTAPVTMPPVKPVTAPPAAPAAPAPAAPAAAPAETGFVHATVKVVDLAGNPLAGMAPIVTRQPNAFDKPVSMGDPTDAGGMGTIRFENKEHLFLRAWDPTLGYFPNNFYEVLPGGNNVEGVLTIQMVASSSLEAQLVLPDGTPAASQTVGLLLSHATRGPWWPAQADTNAEGVVQFPNLPAGEFVLGFKVTSGAQLDVKETPLPPGAHINLGVLTLR